MKRVRVEAWCDNHHARDGSLVEGRTYTLNLTGAPREVELCAECHEQLVAPLVELLKAHGAPVTEAPASAPASGKRGGGRPRKGETAEQAAARRAAEAEPESASVHAVPLPGMADRVFYVDDRVQCPLCPTASLNLAALRQHAKSAHDVTIGQLLGTTCPLCAVEVTSNLGQHTSAAHDCDAPASFDVAAELGDEHGVIAAARHRWQELAASTAA